MFMTKTRRAPSRRALLATVAGVAVIGAAAPMTALAGAAMLPTGGVVQSGQASITASGASALTVSQSSKAAIIDWSSFSIGRGASVTFNNGSGATLNRVLSGGPISNLDGLLSATGSVYLINPSGVIIGKDGVVKVGGTFAASTLDVDDSAFLNGGSLTFSGTSKASVVNLGKVEALGGDVVLAAAVVENAGTIQAPNGDVGVLAGYSVTIKDEADQNGLFTVQLGGVGTSVTNQGLIQAAAAELRANGGNIYALAGDTASVIKATQVTHQGGQIFLTAPGGTVSVAKGVTLDASGVGSGDGGHIQVDSADTSFHGTALAEGGPLGGDGGLVETSGGTLDFSGAKVDTTAAHGATGTWLLDPDDLTVDATGAQAIEDGLASNNVVVQTTASSATVTIGTTAASASAYGTVNPSGVGDITIAAPISWSSANTLTLDAWHSLHVDAPITVKGAGGVVINTNAAGTDGDYDFGLTATGFLGSISFTGGASSGASLTINGAAYTLLYSMSDLQGITDLGGDYALATSLDASGTTYGAALVGGPSSTFTGAFEGLGHTISKLTINDTSGNGYDGLFGQSSGTIRDIGLVGGSVSGSYNYVGGLVGEQDAGSITNAYATGAVSGHSYVGGLVGEQDVDSITNANVASITNAYATGPVSGTGSYVGGLVGFQATGGAITDAYATGAVSGLYDVGGLVGLQSENYGPLTTTITDAYATGAVSGVLDLGGLVGNASGSITYAFATGAVTGVDYLDGVHPSSDVGGLVGIYASNANLDSLSEIDYAYATGAVRGTNYVGGLLGQYFGTNVISVLNVYATGAVSGNGAFVAGFIGDNCADCTALGYYDIQTSGQASGGLTGTGLTTRQMQGLDPLYGSTYFSPGLLGPGHERALGRGPGALSAT